MLWLNGFEANPPSRMRIKKDTPETTQRTTTCVHIYTNGPEVGYLGIVRRSGRNRAWE